MTDPATRVCPRCGSEAHEHEYCQTCGLHLTQQPELPTRAEWEEALELTSGGQRRVTPPSDRLASARRRTLIGVGVAGLVGILILVAAATSAAPDYSEFDVRVSIDEAAGLSMGSYEAWRPGHCEGKGREFSCEVFMRDGYVADQAYESYGEDAVNGLGMLGAISPTYEVVVDNEGCFEATLRSERRDDTDEVLFGEDPTPTTLSGCGVGDYD